MSSNYDFRVYINKRQIAGGRLEEHARPLGWEGLVAQLAQQAFYSKYEPPDDRAYDEWVKTIPHRIDRS